MSVFRHVFFAVMRCLLFFSPVLRCGKSPNVLLIIIPYIFMIYSTHHFHTYVHCTWITFLLFISQGNTCHISPHVRDSMTVLDSGFHPVDSGFRVLDSGFQLSGFRIPKRAGFQIFSVLMLFFAFRFRVRILLYWKTLFRMHSKFVFFFDL